MKRILRIIIGSSLCIFPTILATWIWLFFEEDNWIEDIGKMAWYMASGQWEKLPD